MRYFVRKEFAEGDAVTVGPFATEEGAKMALANQVEQAFDAEEHLAGRVVQADINEVLRDGRCEACGIDGKLKLLISIVKEG